MKENDIRIAITASVLIEVGVYPLLLAIIELLMIVFVSSRRKTNGTLARLQYQEHKCFRPHEMAAILLGKILSQESS